MKKITEVKWEAEDGTVFKTMGECARHERKLNLNPLEPEAIHREIQRVKALHGPYLAKSFREYRDAKEIAMGWFDIFMCRAERSPETALELGESMVNLSKAWQTYKTDLSVLENLRINQSKAKYRK